MYLSKLGGGQLQYVPIISDRPPKCPHAEFPSYMSGLMLKHTLERERERESLKSFCNSSTNTDAVVVQIHVSQHKDRPVISP